MVGVVSERTLEANDIRDPIRSLPTKHTVTRGGTEGLLLLADGISTLFEKTGAMTEYIMDYDCTL